MLNLKGPPPLSLYVHIPWCVRKCPYCDFNSHTQAGALPERQYLAALFADLEAEQSAVGNREVISIFIGGGTPSLFTAETIGRLLDGLGTRLQLQTDIEITLEANPGTIERQRLAEFRAAGINRLSLGIQSFDDGALKQLGRIHNARDAHLAVEAAKTAGYDSINLDLMFGLPGQNEVQAVADIETAIACRPQHISHYQLTIEPDTAFYRRPPPLPDDELSWSMQSRCAELLSDYDYRHYEVSAWSLDGHQCRHNMNYWLFGDYLGIGAGAHQKLSMPGRGQITRRWKQRLPAIYLDCTGQQRIAGENILSEEDIQFEFMLNALRLPDGFPVGLFGHRTGLPLSSIDDRLRLAEERGLLEIDTTRIKPTINGQQYLNELLMLFLPG